MPIERLAGKSTTRRYSVEEKAAVVWMVRSLQAETGMSHGAVRGVAEQLGYEVESVRSWVKRAEINDGVRPGVSTEESERVRDLEQEVRELRRVNEILRIRASRRRRVPHSRRSPVRTGGRSRSSSRTVSGADPGAAGAGVRVLTRPSPESAKPPGHRGLREEEEGGRLPDRGS